MALQATTPAGLAAAAALAGAGLLALGFALREVPAIVRLLAAGPTDVFSLSTEPNGPASVAGCSVRHEEGLATPFTGRECLAVTYEVREEQSTRHGTTWNEIDDGRGAVPFRIEDDTGSVLVDPSTVRLYLRERDSTIEVASDEAPPEPIRNYIDRDPGVDSAGRSNSTSATTVDTSNAAWRRTTRSAPSATPGTGRASGPPSGRPTSCSRAATIPWS